MLAITGIDGKHTKASAGTLTDMVLRLEIIHALPTLTGLQGVSVSMPVSVPVYLTQPKPKT